MLIRQKYSPWLDVSAQFFFTLMGTEFSYDFHLAAKLFSLSLN